MKKKTLASIEVIQSIGYLAIGVVLAVNFYTVFASHDVFTASPHASNQVSHAQVASANGKGLEDWETSGYYD